MIDQREFLRDWHPEFAETPEELVPWPYRPTDAAFPAFCPKCGRALLHYWWGGDTERAGYHEMACAGPLQGLMALRPSILFVCHHWQLTVGKDDRRVRRGWKFDPLTGDPMDGVR